MGSERLNAGQLERLQAPLARHGRYLSRLVERMEQEKWPRDDALYARTVAARDATLSLIASIGDMRRELDTPAWQRAMRG